MSNFRKAKRSLFACHAALTLVASSAWALPETSVPTGTASLPTISSAIIETAGSVITWGSFGSLSTTNALIYEPPISAASLAITSTVPAPATSGTIILETIAAGGITSTTGVLLPVASAGAITISSVQPVFAGAMPAPILNVPEPETYAMLLAGLGLLSLTVSRRQRVPH